MCGNVSLSPGLYLGPSFFPSLFSLSLSLSVWGVEERESGLASQSGVRGEGGGDDVRCVVLLCVCVSVGGRLTPVFHRSGRAWGWRSVGDFC